MTEQQARDLLDSLGWYDCSAYHANRVRELLRAAYPGEDFSMDLDHYRICMTTPAGTEGSPR